MAYLYLLGAVCGSAMLSIMSSLFNKKNEGIKNLSFFYTFLATSSAFFSWLIIYLLQFSFDPWVFLYSLAYGLFYTLALIGLYKSLENGSVSLTAFIKQLSLIGVAVWGFFFWKTPMSANVVIGLVLIIIALYLCLKPDKTDGAAVSLKWVFFAFFLFVGNAGCSIVQKYEQMAFDGQHGNLLMVTATAISALICFMLYQNGNKPDLKKVKKSTLVFPILSGISSAVLNVFIIMLIASPMSESVFFPGIAVGGILLTILFSVLIFKEKLKPIQWTGLLIGTVALIFLNL